jgi:hypothetical protein
MPDYTFADCAFDVLKTANRPLTYQDTWDIAVETGIAENPFYF